jgi:hypothetical protein
MAVEILNTLLQVAYQPSRAIMFPSEQVVLDFVITVADAAAPVPASRILWYPEFTFDNPNAPTARWFRELAEEDIGNGDVRMPKTVRRFTELGGADLAAGAHLLSAQFKRTHDYYRIQIARDAAAGDLCRAQVFAVFGSIPTSP